ncbi:MAG: hypothetical protein Q4G25_04055 [Paracoccus sp. (in: a-proteobacteria)]|nr:hypothetical protein [Paracoccus sp. (in: a-proteobacteria)]
MIARPAGAAGLACQGARECRAFLFVRMVPDLWKLRCLPDHGCA